jgi:hypothetical protein
VISHQLRCGGAAISSRSGSRSGSRQQSAAAAAAAAAEPGASSSDRSSDGSAAAPQRDLPWAFGAQTNERLLAWDDSAQSQLLKIWLWCVLDCTMAPARGASSIRLTHAHTGTLHSQPTPLPPARQNDHKSGELGIEQDALAERIAALGNLLPDLATKLHALRAPLALRLLQDLPAVAERLLALRRLLPGADVSAMAARAPDLMLAAPLEKLEAAAANLAAHLPGVDTARLCEREPLLLAADIAALLEDARRLAPPGADAVALLARDPSALLDMGAAGMPSTLEFN